jgi:iron complex outermembrane receptor protein
MRIVAVLSAALSWSSVATGAAHTLLNPVPVAAAVPGIVAQPLAQALAQFARQTGLQVVYVSSAVVGAFSNGAPIGLTPRETLIRLLQGTGLDFEFLNEHTVRIFLRSKPVPSSEGPARRPETGRAGMAAAPPAGGLVTGSGAEDNKGDRTVRERKKTGFFGHLAALFALCGPLLAAGPAFCENAPANTNVGADTNPGTLQEVVVTAERRAENVQTTPIAVTALTGGQLEADNVTDIQSLTAVAPTLSIANDGPFQLVVMRGVGATLGESPESTGVPVVLDNMVNPRGTGLGWAWFDIADVETLRGPQGTLVGANSTGGAILVTSVNPNFRGVNGYFTVQAGNYHEWLTEAAGNLPLTDTFAMRVAIHTDTENSPYHDVGFSGSESIPNESSDSMLDPGNKDEHSARVSALWKPTDNFQFLLKVQYDENNTDGLPYNVNPNTYVPLPGLGCPYGIASNGQCETHYLPYYSGNPWVLNYASSTKYEYWDRFYSGDIRYTLPDSTVFHFFAGSQASQIPAVGNTCDCSANYGSALTGGGAAETEPITNDYIQAELISPSNGRFNWILGAAYIRSMNPQSSVFISSAPPATVAEPSISNFALVGTTREEGIYGNINWQFTNTLQLEAGLRGNWDNNYQTGQGLTFSSGKYSCATDPCISFPTTPPSSGVDAQGHYAANHQTYKIGLNWSPTTSEFFYAFMARGYKSGLVQEHGYDTPPFNALAETLNDYEAGWKGTFLNHHLTNQLGLYYSDYDNMQQNIFNPNYPNAGGIANVPHALIEGIEESLQAQIGHLGVDIAAAYTHSALSPLIDIPTYEFPAGIGIGGAGSYLPNCAPGVASSATCFNYSRYAIDLKGVQDPYAPQLTGNFTVQYGIPIGNATLQPRLQFSYTSKQFSKILQNNDYYELDPRHVWNAYLDFMDGRYQTTLYVTNMTNETYMENNTGSAVLYGPPQQYGLKVTFNY